MAFNVDMTVRALTELECETLKTQPELLAIVEKTVKAIRIVNARMPQN